MVPWPVMSVLLRNTFPTYISLFDVGAAATGMVFHFRTTVVHYCTGRDLTPDTARVAMLGIASKYENVGAKRGAWGNHWGCSVYFPAVYYLRFCLSAAAAPTSGSEICGMGVVVVRGVYVGATFPATVLHTSLVRSATCLWSRVLTCVIWSTTWCLKSTWMLVRTCIL